MRSRGSGRLGIEFAGLRLRLEGLGPEEETHLRSRYGAFVTEAPPASDSGRISVRHADVPWFLRVQERPERAPERYRLEQRREGDRLLVYSYEFAGWYDLLAREGELALTSSEGEAVHRGVENFLRVVTAHRVLAKGGFLLHGAGLVRADRAYVFFGPSGAGKTTVTLLSRGDLVLSDDLILVRGGEPGYEACSVPFRGLYREPPATTRAFPIHAFYRLIQDRSDSLEPLSGPRGAGELLASLPFVVEGPATAAMALEAVSRAAEAVPVYRLHFRKSPEFWDLLTAGS